MGLDADLERAVQIARWAGEVLLSYFATESMDTRSKGERDVVTAADLASEQLVRERLREAFPSDGVVGEEGTRVTGKGSRRWFVDPLDGTLNYSRGIPFWSVSLALFDGDQPVLGVVYDPIRGDMFAAAQGTAAFHNDRPIGSSGVVAPELAVIHLTVDFNEHSLLQGVEDLTLLAPRVFRSRNLGSAALALAYVAAGHVDAMLHRYAHAWDYGAGVVLVREAGGVVSEMDGSTYTDRSKAILATSTPELHAALRRLIHGETRPPAQP